MNNSRLAVILLGVCATVLLLAHLMLPVATAQVVIKDRDYQVLTVPTDNGSDAVFVADGRTGQIAVFTFDAGTQTLKPRAIRPMSAAFRDR